MRFYPAASNGNNGQSINTDKIDNWLLKVNSPFLKGIIIEDGSSYSKTVL